MEEFVFNYRTGTTAESMLVDEDFRVVFHSEVHPPTFGKWRKPQPPVHQVMSVSEAKRLWPREAKSIEAAVDRMIARKNGGSV